MIQKSFFKILDHFTKDITNFQVAQFGSVLVQYVDIRSIKTHNIMCSGYKTYIFYTATTLQFLVPSIFNSMGNVAIGDYNDYY